MSEHEQKHNSDEDFYNIKPEWFALDPGKIDWGEIKRNKVSGSSYYFFDYAKFEDGEKVPEEEEGNYKALLNVCAKPFGAFRACVDEYNDEGAPECEFLKYRAAACVSSHIFTDDWDKVVGSDASNIDIQAFYVLLMRGFNVLNSLYFVPRLPKYFDDIIKRCDPDGEAIGDPAELSDNGREKLGCILSNIWPLHYAKFADCRSQHPIEECDGHAGLMADRALGILRARTLNSDLVKTKEFDLKQFGNADVVPTFDFSDHVEDIADQKEED